MEVCLRGPEALGKVLFELQEVVSSVCPLPAGVLNQAEKIETVVFERKAAIQGLDERRFSFGEASLRIERVGPGKECAGFFVLGMELAGQGEANNNQKEKHGLSHTSEKV